MVAFRDACLPSMTRPSLAAINREAYIYFGAGATVALVQALGTADLLAHSPLAAALAGEVLPGADPVNDAAARRVLKA